MIVKHLKLVSIPIMYVLQSPKNMVPLVYFVVCLRTCSFIFYSATYVGDFFFYILMKLKIWGAHCLAYEAICMYFRVQFLANNILSISYVGSICSKLSVRKHIHICILCFFSCLKDESWQLTIASEVV
jgi:hypothetical protein